MWIDAHAHLDFDWFDEDREAVVQRANDAGVTHIVNSGDDLESSRRVVELAQRYPDFMSATLGVHPTRANTWSEEVREAFMAMIESDEAGRIVGIGETGLDFFREGAECDVQVAAFKSQIELAQRFNLMLVIHCRDAFPETLAILEDYQPSKVLFHCYTGDLPTAQRIWRNGWITSFSGIITYPKNEELRECVRQAPAGQFTIETDAPFLPPQSQRGNRNEPSYVVEVGEYVASLRGEVRPPFFVFP